ncbi:hypothetical protein WME75_26080 [Sorangium sp. So ce1014]
MEAMFMRYRVFGRTGLRVSSLALGTGNFGTGWGHGATRDEAKEIFDGYRVQAATSSIPPTITS